MRVGNSRSRLALLSEKWISLSYGRFPRGAERVSSHREVLDSARLLAEAEKVLVCEHTQPCEVLAVGLELVRHQEAPCVGRHPPRRQRLYLR